VSECGNLCGIGSRSLFTIPAKFSTAGLYNIIFNVLYRAVLLDTCMFPCTEQFPCMYFLIFLLILSFDLAGRDGEGFVFRNMTKAVVFFPSRCGSSELKHVGIQLLTLPNRGRFTLTKKYSIQQLSFSLLSLSTGSSSLI
jgi:hypothetical protein